MHQVKLFWLFVSPAESHCSEIPSNGSAFEKMPVRIVYKPFIKFVNNVWPPVKKRRKKQIQANVRSKLLYPCYTYEYCTQ